jgi:hypothetical protein
MASLSSDRSVALTLVETPTNALVKASLEPAYTIFDLILAVSGALYYDKNRSGHRQGPHHLLRNFVTYQVIDTNLLPGRPSVVVKFMS